MESGRKKGPFVCHFLPCHASTCRNTAHDVDICLRLVYNPQALRRLTVNRVWFAFSGDGARLA